MELIQAKPHYELYIQVREALEKSYLINKRIQDHGSDHAIKHRFIINCGIHFG